MSRFMFLLSVALLVLSQNIHAQQLTGINAKTLSEYIQQEKQEGSAWILNDKDVKTVSDELDQVVFIRSDASIPDIDLIIRYIFFKKDSTIAEIRWEWDAANHNRKLNNPKDSSFRAEMARFYRLWNIFYRRMWGPGDTTGILPKRLHPDAAYKRSVSWLLPDTKVRWEIVMRNTYRPEDRIYPEHKVVLSMRDISLPRMAKYRDRELVRRIRKPKPYIDIPVKGAPVPLLPGCDNANEAYNCMNAYIARRLEEKIRERRLDIPRDTLRISFRVNYDGTVTLLGGTDARNKELVRLGEEVIRELPRFKPAYSAKLDQNVSAGYSLLFIVEDNKVKYSSFNIPLR